MARKSARGKVTLKMISERLGVSPATVSKALRDSTDISDEMKAKVRALTEAMGYHPNWMARSLARRRSNLLGVIVPDLNISYYADLVQGIYECAHERGYEPIIMFHHESPEKERKNLQFLYSLQVDGILINGTNGHLNSDFLWRIRSEGTPVVCYDRKIPRYGFSYVAIDEEKTMDSVLGLLERRGRRRIAYIGPTEGTDVTVERFQTFFDLLGRHGLAEQSCSISCEPNAPAAENQLKRALAEGATFDAIVCSGGLVAYGAGRAIQEAGLRMPEDVLLVEYGDNSIVQRLGVSYITVNQSPFEMSQTAVELMETCLKLPPEEWRPQQISVPAKLIYYDHNRHTEEIIETIG